MDNLSKGMITEAEMAVVKGAIDKLGSHRNFLTVYAKHLEDVLDGDENEAHQRFVAKLQARLDEVLELFEY